MKFCTALAAALLVLGLGVPTAHAQATLYWDINGTADGATFGDGIGDGTWDLSTTANWNTDPTGGAAGTIQAWTNAASTYVDDAVFAAGSDLGSDLSIAGAFVTVSGTQSAASVTIEEGAVALRTGAVDTPQTTVMNGARLEVDSILRFSTLAGKITLQGGTYESSNYGHAGSYIRNSQSLEVDGTGTLDYDDVYTPDAADCDCTIYTPINSNAILGVGGTTANGGAGTLIKTGAAEVRYQGAGLPLTTFAKLRVEGGLFRLGFSASVQDTRGFGADPLVETADAITLDGGNIGTSFFLSQANMHPNRGVTIGPNGGGFHVGGGSLNVQGPLSGDGTLTLFNPAGVTGGTIQLSNANNTFSGPLVVNAGTLSLAQSLSPGSLAGLAGTVSIASGMTLTTGSNDISTGYGGTISGAGSLAKTGSGTFTMDGTKSYTGDTSVLEGTLSTNSASLADLADVYLTTGSFFNLNFAGTDTIDELFFDNMAQAVGTWGAIGSGADNETALITGAGLLGVTTGPGGGVNGDFNEDGVVDARDYITWRKNTANSPLPNDNGLGTQAERYDLWVTNFGMMAPGGGSGAGAAVPEPASLALVVLGLAVTLFGRRSR